MKIIAGSLTFLWGCLLFLSFPPQHSLAEEGKGRETPFKEAVAMFERGDTDRAIEVMKRIVSADGSNAEAYDQLGYFFLVKKQFDDSLNAFTAALKINPDLRTSKTGMGLALIKKGDMKGAETILTGALALNPYPSSTHYALGLLYEKLNDYEKAVSQYKDGIKTFKSGKK
jgi:tetratricopeptide (TPR) repeat protein